MNFIFRNIIIRFSTAGGNNYEALNDSLYKWVNAERFQTFPKVTRGNINQLFLTNKNLVLAVVEENQLEEIQPDMIAFRDMVQSVIMKKRHKYHKWDITTPLDGGTGLNALSFRSNFQFGWIANPELANSIAMMIVPLPSLIVINTTTSHHYIPEDEPRKLTPHAIELFLEQIYNESAPVGLAER